MTGRGDTRFLFFSGKGGVGKTTMAAATAVRLADQGRRTLIVTTDPASNLGDVFGREIGHRITPISGVENLWAMEIDPDKATEEYRERVLGPMRAVMPEDVVQVIEEQFRSPCTTEIAAFDRFVDFMDGGGFDAVVFDTAPTGHTLRLLELPVDWSRYIEASAQGAGQTCIGPVQAIQESKEKYDRAVGFLTDPARTTFVFVLQPEETIIYETQRSVDELAGIGIRSQELIVNGIVPAEAAVGEFLQRRYGLQQAYLAEIKSRFSSLPMRLVSLRDIEVRGVDSLREVAAELLDGRRPSSRAGTQPYATTCTQQPAQSDNHHMLSLLSPQASATKAVFFAGKGGVGKTTLSCVTAVHLASQGVRTLLVTTDPASHLANVLGCQVTHEPRAVPGRDGLWAAQVDQEKAAQAYKEKVLAEARAHYSEEMLMAVKEELESPCTEEIAAFERFLEYLQDRSYEVVIFDTAPTGHTLRLLSLPFDYSQQVELMVATTPAAAAAREASRQRFEAIIQRLRDPSQTVFGFVVYPEYTPIVEAQRAMEDLKAAGITTQFVVANQVIPPEACASQLFQRRRAMQGYYLSQIRARFQTPVVVMPLLEESPRGAAALAEAGRLLWDSELPWKAAAPERRSA